MTLIASPFRHRLLTTTLCLITETHVSELSMPSSATETKKRTEIVQYVPSISEIEEACRKIRENWTEEERCKRAAFFEPASDETVEPASEENERDPSKEARAVSVCSAAESAIEFFHPAIIPGTLPRKR